MSEIIISFDYRPYDPEDWLSENQWDELYEKLTDAWGRITDWYPAIKNMDLEIKL